MDGELVSETFFEPWDKNVVQKRGASMRENVGLIQIGRTSIMITYIALLRGINVGGKNKIKMSELKRVFEMIGLNNVQTYIQSGNVIFKSNETEKPLRKKIEHEIEDSFGFSVTVVLRTATEFDQIIKNYPFTEEEVRKSEPSSQAESQYIALLTKVPLQENIVQLEAYKGEKDDCRIIGREVFLLFHHSIRNSKLANNLHKLNVPTTVRNWKTIFRLDELAKSME